MPLGMPRKMITPRLGRSPAVTDRTYIRLVNISELFEIGYVRGSRPWLAGSNETRKD